MRNPLAARVVTLLVALVPLGAAAQSSGDFRNLFWGDSLQTVLSKERAQRATDWSMKYPRYLVTINGEPAELSYRIDYGQLWGGAYFLPARVVDVLNAADLQEGVRTVVLQCQQLRVLLDEKYGPASTWSLLEGMSMAEEEENVPSNFTDLGVTKALIQSLDRWKKEPTWTFRWELPRTSIGLSVNASFRPEEAGGPAVAKLWCAASYGPAYALTKGLIQRGEQSRREGL